MSWTSDETEQLGHAEYKVEDLGDEEQEQRLGEMRLDRDDRERHPGKVAKGVPYKGSSWVPVTNPVCQHSPTGNMVGRTNQLW